MINEEKAIMIASEELNSHYDVENDRVVLVEGSVVKKYYGWAFAFNSEKYLQTDDDMYMLMIGYVLIEKSTGKLHYLGTAFPIDKALERFEEEMGYK